MKRFISTKNKTLLICFVMFASVLATISVNAQSGAALNFDGVDDKVDLGTSLGNFGTGNFTFETWFKTTATGDRAIVSKRAGCNASNFWNLRLINGLLNFEIYGSSNIAIPSTLNTYNDGNWHHVACVRNINVYTLYVNGVQVAQNSSGAGSVNPFNFSNSISLLIGGGPCGNFSGTLDETRIWNVARNSYEILQSYNCEIASTAANLILNYHYNQGTGGGNNSTVISATDVSSNNNNGTLTNFALSGTTSNWVTPGAVTSGVSCAAIASQNFQLNGSGGQDWAGGNCYTLTTNQQAIFGSIWHKQKVNLSQDFDMSANLNFGSNNSPGADGITFAFQNVCTSTGVAGGDIGIGGVNPSLIVEFDTYQNGAYGDPTYDHLAIQKNGDLNHTGANQLAAPVQIDPSNVNVETGVDFLVRILWTASTHSLNVYVNGNLRTTYSGDIVAQIFASSPYVYWGFTAGTGGESNLQKVCVTQLPTNIVSLASTATICAGSGYQANIPGYTSYNWSPSAGVSNTSIANPVLSPTTNTTYTLSVTDACNNVQTQSIAITVNPIPNVAATSVSSTVCANSTVQLNATGATSYTWSPSTTLSSSTIANPVATPTANTTYTVTGTTNGCSATASVAINTINAPTITTTGNTAICAGAFTNISATQTGGNGYTWSPSTGLSSTSSATPVASPTATTTYTVSTSNGTCTTSQQVVVTVNPIPTVSVNSPSVCAGSSVNVVATTSPSGGTYSWASGGNTASISVSPSANTTYTVTYTANGCSNTSSGNVTVNQIPNINATGTASICQGASTSLTATGGNSYQWSPTTGLSSGSVANPTATPTTTTTYTVTGYAGNNCPNTATVVVTVTPISAAITSSSTNLTCGGTANLTATGGTTYAWTPTAGLSAANIANPIATPNATTTYTVVATSGSCTASNNVTINVNGITTNAGSDAVICSGGSTQLNAVNTLGSGYYTNVATGYTFTPIQSFYSSISNGTIFLDSNSPTMDDVVSGAITIPAFKFNNVTYTSLYISSNGFITFGSAPSATNYTPLSSTETYAGCISVFAGDLGVYPNTLSPSIMYKIVGSEFVIQWKDFGRYFPATGNVDEYMTFQIRLNTTTNEVRVVYGSTTITGSSTVYPQIGLRGPNNNFATNVNNRSVVTGAGNWYSGSTAGTSNTSSCLINTNEVFTYPHSGLNWVWTPGNFYTSNYTWLPTTGLSNATIANPVASPTATTSYVVSYNYGTCTNIDTVIVTVNICTGVDEVAEAKEIKVYPNPANDILTINVTNASTVNSVHIIDILGKEVLNEKINSTNNNINIQQLKSGTYFVKVVSNDNFETRKIQIIH